MNLYWLSGLLNGLISSGVGLFIYSRAPRNPKHQTLGLYCLTLSVWGYGYAAWQGASSADDALLWIRILMVGVLMIPAAYLHHILVLLDHQHDQRGYIYTAYAFTAVLLFLNTTPLIVADVAPQREFPYWPTAGSALPLVIVWFALSLLYGSYCLYQKYVQAHGRRRAHYLYLLAATVIGCAGGSTNWPLWYGIQVPPIGTIFVGVYVIVAAYVLVHYRMLDLSAAVQAGVTVLLAMIPLSVPFLALLTYAQHVYFGHAEMVFSLIVTAGIAMMIVAASRLMNRIQRAMVSILYPSRRRLQEQVSSFSKTLVNNLDVNALTHDIVRHIRDAMDVTHTGMYLFDPHTHSYLSVAVAGAETALAHLQSISANAPLTGYLLNTQDVALLRQRDDGTNNPLRAAVRSDLQQMRADICVPLLSNDKLLGFCALGPRCQPEPFTSHDIDLLLTLCAEAGIALQNAITYEDLKQSHQEMRRSERLHTLEAMAAGLAHEIRNPLTSVRAFVDLASERSHDTGFLVRFGEVARNDVSHIEQLTKDILDYARPHDLSIHPENINTILHAALHSLHSSCMHAPIRLQTDLQSDLPDILVDRPRLERGLLNIFRCAAQSLDVTHGTLSVCTRHLFQNHEASWIRIDITNPDYAVEQGDVDRMFDPFHRTAKCDTDTAQSTGMALAIALQIIQEHHGHIDVKHDAHTGITFSINLPACLTSMDASESQAASFPAMS